MFRNCTLPMEGLCDFEVRQQINESSDFRTDVRGERRLSLNAIFARLSLILIAEIRDSVAAKLLTNSRPSISIATVSHQPNAGFFSVVRTDERRGWRGSEVPLGCTRLVLSARLCRRGRRLSPILRGRTALADAVIIPTELDGPSFHESALPRELPGRYVCTCPRDN
jgi:hypothetical protein